jgi:hypothetical protein
MTAAVLQGQSGAQGAPLHILATGIDRRYNTQRVLSGETAGARTRGSWRIALPDADEVS